MPPLVTTKSYLSLMRRVASMISLSSSSTTSTLFKLYIFVSLIPRHLREGRTIPSEKHHLAMYAELVYTHQPLQKAPTPLPKQLTSTVYATR